MKKRVDISPKEIADWLKEVDKTDPSVEDVRQAEDALLAYTASYSTSPSASLRDKILGKITHLNAQKKQQTRLNLDDLPILDESANWLEWQEVTRNISPPPNFENIHLHPLESNEKRELFIAWVKEYIEEEVHHDLLESFLILEGSCECHITGEDGNTRIVYLAQGDFLTMRIGETHDIHITSLRPAKAILQWKKIVA